MDIAPAQDLRALTSVEFQWTRRQREVLDRIADGKSNQQIADELGISLDGAKWHMREILSKLNVETREDAADYWRLYNGWQPRLHRTWRHFSGAGALKWAAAATGGAAVAVGVVAVMLSLGGDDDAVGRRADDPPLRATPSSTPQPLSVTLDSAPRSMPTGTTRVAGPVPASAFPPWDGASTVIYDIERGVAIDLGPGAQPAAFSPDGTKAVWTSGPGFGQGEEVQLIDLPTGMRRSLGAGISAGWASDDTVTIDRGLNSRWALNIGTGEMKAAPEASVGSYVTDPEPYPRQPYAVSKGGAAGPKGPGLNPSQYSVTDRATGNSLLTFEAIAATPAGPTSIAAVSATIDGRANVYLIEIATGATTFVASVRPGLSNFPFSATADAVLWTDGYCPDDGGMVTVFERSNSQLTALDLGVAGPDSRWVQLTPEGNIAAGSFGANVLFDRRSLEAVAVIPPRPDGNQGDISWSPDYRYASHGPTGGHGGLCV